MNEIQKSINLICQRGQVSELRALRIHDPETSDTRNYYGFFNDPEIMVKEAERIGEHAYGVYFTPNPVKPNLLERSPNHVQPAVKGMSAGNGDIQRIHWLLIDFDPVRDTDTSSTEAEHALAFDLAASVRQYLRDKGWPDPIFADSGNGNHLMYRVDLPISDSIRIKRILEALAGQFNTDDVVIDTSVANPARIWRLYGTWARKGEDTPERPHRQSHILWDETPDEIQVVTDDQLKAVEPAVTAQASPSVVSFKKYCGNFDLQKWIDNHQDQLSLFALSGPQPWGYNDTQHNRQASGQRWVMHACPWNSDHTNGSAFIVQREDGAIGAGCHHNGCQGKGWHDLRDIVEPGWLDRQRYPMTDLGNAERLVYRHGDDIRYCNSQKTWFIWDGCRWKADDTAEIMRRAKHTVRKMLLEAEQIQDSDDREKAMKWILQSESEFRLKAMVNLAGSEEGIASTVDDFDQSHWLLNVKNGTIDLRTGNLLDHDRNNMMTKLAPVEWQGLSAKLPLWEQFLDDATDGDKDLQTFLQRAVGYSLTGDASEEVLFFVHGPGAAGKSTFMEAIRGVLSDYSNTADFETFIKRNGTGGPRNDIARLAGSRLVASVEVDEGKALAEGLIKSITGGEKVSARFLYKEAFEFLPTFKLWLVANDTPDVKSSDAAMWRRILRVPFDHVVPKSKRDPKLKAQLRDPDVAGPGILAWAVQGCLDWQKNGLQIPTAVTRATEEYRAEMNPLSEFVTDCGRIDPISWEPVSNIRSAFGEWREVNGGEYLSDRKLASSLRELGCEPEQRQLLGKKTRGWKGICLLPDRNVGVGQTGGQDRKDGMPF